MGVLCGAKPGIKKLSELVIDADKDWQGFGINNLKELAAVMTKGDLPVRGNAILERLIPGAAGLVLTSAGPGHLPAWAPGGSTLEFFFPVWLELVKQAELYTPDFSDELGVSISSPHEEIIDPTRLPALELGLAAGLYTPDHTGIKDLPVVSGYQAEAHVASAFGYFTAGTNSISTVDMIRGSRFMLIGNATAQSIAAYIEVTGAGPTVHVKAAIYDRDENKIQETNQLTLAPGAADWQTFPFGTPPGLTGNREYWLLILAEDIAGSDCLAFYNDLDGVGINQGLYLAHTYNTFPANLSGRTKQQARFSIYCSYT